MFSPRIGCGGKTLLFAAELKTAGLPEGSLKVLMIKSSVC